MVASRIACIDYLQGDRRAACDTTIIRVEPACGELIANTASASTIRLAGAVYAALEELLVDRAVVDARTAGPFP